LRHGGSALIDRKDPKQAIPAIKGLEYIENITVLQLFFQKEPEEQEAKSICTNRFKILCKSTPSAYVVPISINNSWKIVKYGFFH
jgi:1-acyl-sn-glycerol-3-phosphate acyltransferase